MLGVYSTWAAVGKLRVCIGIDYAVRPHRTGVRRVRIGELTALVPRNRVVKRDSNRVGDVSVVGEAPIRGIAAVAEANPAGLPHVRHIDVVLPVAVLDVV